MRKLLKKTTFAVLIVACAGLSFASQSARTIGPVGEMTQSGGHQAPNSFRVVSDKQIKCGGCHADKEDTQHMTPMAHALEMADVCQVLKLHPSMSFKNGPYTYVIAQQPGGATYTVSDGKATISEPLVYCFGQGEVGQTYVFRHKGTLYESRVTFYRTIDGLDFTTGQSTAIPSSVEEALGRPLSAQQAGECFGCHAPSAVEGSRLSLDALEPGVTCRDCHGSGEKHVQAVSSGSSSDPQIFNPGKLNAIQLSQEFCGRCHRSFDQVMGVPGQFGINNIRFQPYRIFNSRGHNKLDARISCVACHDPHRPLERESSYYDAKCLQCHLSGADDTKTASRAAAACKTGKRDCTGCHMPKVEIPGMHFKFTDHWIRVVRLNDKVPR